MRPGPHRREARFGTQANGAGSRGAPAPQNLETVPLHSQPIARPFWAPFRLLRNEANGSDRGSAGRRTLLACERAPIPWPHRWVGLHSGERRGRYLPVQVMPTNPQPSANRNRTPFGIVDRGGALAEMVREAFRIAREKLIDLTLRNAMLNFRHSEASTRYVRIIVSIGAQL